VDWKAHDWTSRLSASAAFAVLLVRSVLAGDVLEIYLAAANLLLRILAIAQLALRRATADDQGPLNAVSVWEPLASPLTSPAARTPSFQRGAPPPGPAFAPSFTPQIRFPPPPPRSGGPKPTPRQLAGNT